MRVRAEASLDSTLMTALVVAGVSLVFLLLGFALVAYAALVLLRGRSSAVEEPDASPKGAAAAKAAPAAKAVSAPSKSIPPPPPPVFQKPPGAAPAPLSPMVPPTVGEPEGVTEPGGLAPTAPMGFLGAPIGDDWEDEEEAKTEVFTRAPSIPPAPPRTAGGAPEPKPAPRPVPAPDDYDAPTHSFSDAQRDLARRLHEDDDGAKTEVFGRDFGGVSMADLFDDDEEEAKTEVLSRNRHLDQLGDLLDEDDPSTDAGVKLPGRVVADDRKR